MEWRNHRTVALTDFAKQLASLSSIVGHLIFNMPLINKNLLIVKSAECSFCPFNKCFAVIVSNKKVPAANDALAPAASSNGDVFTCKGAFDA